MPFDTAIVLADRLIEFNTDPVAFWKRIALPDKSTEDNAHFSDQVARDDCTYQPDIAS